MVYVYVVYDVIESHQSVRINNIYVEIGATFRPPRLILYIGKMQCIHENFIEFQMHTHTQTKTKKKTGRHNLTLMFNAIETRDRLKEDAVEHGNKVPEQEQLDEKISHV